jgi:hypothetical protein
LLLHRSALLGFSLEVPLLTQKYWIRLWFICFALHRVGYKSGFQVLVVHSSFRIWRWDPPQGNWMDVRHKGDTLHNVHLPCSVTKTLHSIFSRSLVAFDSTLVTLKIVVHRLDSFENVEPPQEYHCKDNAATSIHRSCIRVPDELIISAERRCHHDSSRR